VAVTPFERATVEVGHPDPRPVIACAAERRQEVRVVPDAIEGRAPLFERDVVADGNVRLAAVEAEVATVAIVDADEAVS